MALTRAQAATIYRYALNLERANRLLGPGARRTQAQLAQAVYDRQPGQGGYTRQDANAAVNRARLSYAAGVAMTANPNSLHAVLKRNLPNVPVVRPSRGNYEYIAVGVIRGADASGAQSFIIQSDRKLSGEEVMERIRRRFAAMQDWTTLSGRNMGALPLNAVPDVYIVGASFFDPTRGGTQ